MLFINATVSLILPSIYWQEMIAIALHCLVGRVCRVVLSDYRLPNPVS